jgi:hypothetical protein
VVIDKWLADYPRVEETGTVEAQLDILWPTTGTPNSTEAWKITPALANPYSKRLALFSND